MTWQGWLQILIYVAVLTALTPLLGGYMARVYMGRRVAMERVLGPVERGFYRAVRTDPAHEQDWQQYGRTVLVFSALFWLALYILLRLQGALPFNPLRFGGAPWDITFNTTSSFITNTNWQYYGGETTMSHLSQMAGLAVQNFVSAAVGMAVLAAVIRGFARRETTRLGSFWVDLTRSLLYILLPLSILGTLLLVSQGVVRPSRARLSSPPSTASTRCWHWVPSPRRSPSSSSAPTAAASSTSTRRSRSRTPPPSPTLSSCCSSC
jgi:K+-transporting ATPase ATPase A chain